MDMIAYALPVVDDIPSTYPEAILSSESGNWAGAMEEEMQYLKKNKTWKLAQLPKGMKAIGCKWVFAKKEGFPNKEDVRYKSRLVIKALLRGRELIIMRYFLQLLNIPPFKFCCPW